MEELVFIILVGGYCLLLFGFLVYRGIKAIVNYYLVNAKNNTTTKYLQRSKTK